MKIGIIVDGLQVRRWQAQALARIAGRHEFVLYNCTSARTSPRRLRHALYYLLNLFTIRNPLTRPVPVSGLEVAGRTDFEAEQDGAWQRLPGHLLEQISADRPALILKFGMGLLRVPEASALAVPILSYHHGDVRHFRGRPAGFHEIDLGRRVMGQVVQILSNRLDAGAVVAFAETKVHPHSYRGTLIEAYRHSPLILGQAIANAAAGTVLPHAPTGTNYRLPGNARVARFVLRMVARAVRRLGYGAFFEKAWSVAEAAALPDALLDPGGPEPLPRTGWAIARIPRGYGFLADPFFHPQGQGLLVEALNRSTNLGEVLAVDGERTRQLTPRGVHCSYPAVLTEDGRHFLLPEVSGWSPQIAYPLDGEAATTAIELDIPGRPKLVDPTPLRTADTLFLFANDAAEGSGVLRLWFADGLSGRFAEHRSSPVRISPAGSRMAGAIAASAQGLFRVGQDFAGAYGDGILIFRIEALTRDDYRETKVRSFRFRDVRGPHTLNFRDGRAVFDFYRDRFSPFAGVRRLRQSR
jgi:hypothetical protein